MKALGFIETKGLVGNIEATDAGLGMVHAMALAFDAQLPEYRQRFQTIAKAMKLPGTEALAMVAAVRQLNQQVGICASLKELKVVEPAHFADLSALALQDTCMSSNLVSLTPAQVIAVYTAAYYGA